MYGVVKPVKMFRKFVAVYNVYALGRLTDGMRQACAPNQAR